MRRVLAVLGAVLMVAVALLIRSAVDDDDGGGSASGPNGDSDVPTLLCAEELSDVCDALEEEDIAEVTVEPVGETVDRLGVPDADLEADGWLTLDPFPQQVNDRREFATGSPLFGQPLATNRSSALALVAAADRGEALGDDCGEVDWACVGDAAGEPWTDHGGESDWGAVRPGYDAPDTSATGLLVLAQAMGSHLDDPAFAGQDIDRRWLGDLEDAVPTRTAGTALLKLVQQGGAAFAAVGALGIEAEAAAETPQGDDLTIFYPAPMFRANVVLAPRRGVDLADLLDDDALDEALEAAGWEAGADSEPLPPAGVLDALRTDWERSVRKPTFVLIVTLALAAAACSTGDGDDGGTASDDSTIEDVLGDPGDCIVVDMSVSPEKIDLLTDLARTFNASDAAEVDGECVFVRPQSKSSGLGATLLTEGWDEDVEGPRPVVWSPASSAWGAILDQRLTEQGESPIAGEGTPFMLTPLVIAMPQPMAEALGWPNESIGYADILELSTSGEGWAAFGHPEWGPFRLGKTNPNFSTSGLSALIAQSYAATGKTEGLTTEDLAQQDVIDFATGVESAVVHYGDTTLTFLNNLYRADQRGNSLSYASAVAVEEKSVIDYNRGNPDGVLQPGEEPRPPRVPLVAIYPEEGTLYSDNPFFVLDAEWVSDDEAEGAQLFSEFVQEAENQERVLDYGFRPGNPEVAIGDPVTLENGVDPDQPQTLLEVPEPPVMIELLDRWDEQRKPARVQLVIDISGSMGDAAGDDPVPTKLDLAIEAAVNALDLFADRDVVGLRVFSTEIGPNGTDEVVDLVQPGPMTRAQRSELRDAINGLFPTNGTPLYTATQQAYDDAVAGYDPASINAVVLLSDGVNEDGDQTDDDEQLDELLATLSEGSEGQRAEPVRVFPISYGADADLNTLQEIAEASNAALYNASNPATIDRVLAAVISNF